MIRNAELKDIEALKNIYNDAILTTVATFDTEVKDEEDRLQWFQEHQTDPYVLYVWEEAGEVAGYASLSKYRERSAFSHSVEISVYIKKEYRGRGIGKKLMRHTLDYASANPKIQTVVSLITGTNEASIRLHEQLGFAFCGKLKQVGYKFEQWLDLSVYQIIYAR